jgi:putative DNA primase/helicase
MIARPIAVESASFRLVAKQNGRVKCPVFLLRRGDASETPIAVDDLNTAAGTDREKFLASLPGTLSGEQRDEVGPLLMQLAVQCAAASMMDGRVKGDSKSADSDAQMPLEPWDEPVVGATVLDEIANLILRYMVMSDEEVVAVCLWLLHTFLLDVADFTPYLWVSSPVRICGKSTLLELLWHLAFHARKSDGISAAALYRTIDLHHPTMLIDELDTQLRGDGGEGLRGVLNAGFKRGDVFTRCTGDDHEPRDFHTFCPKVLSGIGKLWDTVASRSIPIRLARASKPELAALSKIRGHLITDECLPHRRKLLRVSDEIRVDVRVSDPTPPPKLGAREADIWRPLLAIADAIGGHWPTTARAAAVHLHGVADEEGDSGLLLLEDVRDIFALASDPAALPTATILAALVQRDDRPWPE